MASRDQEQLIRSLCCQLEERLRRGESGITEQLLESHPGLKQDSEGVLDLIYVEITTREELGDAVAADELRQRFPEWSDRIDRLLSVHRALQVEPLPRDLADTLRDTHADALDTDTSKPRLGDRPSLQEIGPYDILEEVGRGGMGVVYRARERELNRIVALKVIRDAGVAGEDVERLIREARTVARLEHPHIVRIYAAGTHDRSPYVALEYIDGGSLADRLSESTFEPRAACRIVRVLAGAMEYAHQQGVIHRDLKPANVLLGSDGQPRVADFGLARTFLEQTSGDTADRLTRTGAILGSLCYMSPEQVSGRDDRVTPVTDVYGLGTVLYEMLVGRPPFVRESPLDTAHDIQFRDPVPVRTLQPSVPRDVETICLKCLEKDPGRRYGSAAELEAELTRFLNHEPIVARPVSRLTRVVRWARRRPLHAALAASLLALVLTGGILQWRHGRAMAAANDALNRSLAEESAARELADRHFWRAFAGVTTVQHTLADTGLEHEPRMQQARLDVVNQALEIVSELTDERPDDGAIRQETGWLLMLKGGILREMGRHDAALTAYERAESVFVRLLAAGPASDDLQHSLAAATCGRAEALKRTLQFEAARQAYAEGIRRLRDLAERRPDDRRLQTDLVQALVSRLATVSAEERAAATDDLDEAVTRMQQILQQWPEAARSHAVAGQVRRMQGHVARDHGDTATAERYYADAIAAFRRSLEWAPGDRISQVLLVESELARAEELRELRRFDDAQETLEDAGRLLSELRGRYPSIQQYARLQVNLLGLRSILESNVGHAEASIRFAEEAVAIRREILERTSDAVPAAMDLASDLANLSNRLILTPTAGDDRLERAVQYARAALAIPDEYQIEAAAARPLEQFARYMLVLACTHLDRPDEARRELAQLERVTTDVPGERRLLADAWNELLAALIRTDAASEQIAEARTRTLDELTRAVDAGYRDAEELEHTEVLDHVRSDPRFQALLERLAASDE